MNMKSQQSRSTGRRYSPKEKLQVVRLVRSLGFPSENRHLSGLVVRLGEKMALRQSIVRSFRLNIGLNCGQCG